MLGPEPLMRNTKRKRVADWTLDDHFRFCESVEKTYESLLDTLDTLVYRNFSKRQQKAIIDFQYILASTLQRIGLQNASLKKRERALIKGKVRYNKGWFAASMARIRKLREHLERYSWHGKSIGDSFAYAFYAQSLHRLEEHRNLASPGKFFTNGYGGAGELEFIKQARKIGKYFLLYHSITNILTIGDLSLVCLETGEIVAVGELKTDTPEFGEGGVVALKIQCVFVAGFDIGAELMTLEGSTFASDQDFSDFSNRVGAKQMDRMDEMFQSKVPVAKVDANLGPVNSTPKQIAEDILCRLAGRDMAAAARINDSLVALAVKIPKSMERRWRSGLNAKKACSETGVLKLVGETVAPRSGEANYNQLILAEVAPGASLRGTPPLYWWLGAGLFREIVLNRVYMLTLFNPARLLHHLLDEGFEIEPDPTAKTIAYKFKLRVQSGQEKGTVWFHDFETFRFLAQIWLIDEAAIKRMLTVITNRIKEISTSRPSEIKYTLDLHQFFRSV